MATSDNELEVLMQEYIDSFRSMSLSFIQRLEQTSSDERYQFLVSTTAAQSSEDPYSSDDSMAAFQARRLKINEDLHNKVMALKRPHLKRGLDRQRELHKQRELIELGCKGSTGVITAAYRHDLIGLKAILKGLTPDQKSDAMSLRNLKGCTPLHAVVSKTDISDTVYSSVEIIDYLLKNLTEDQKMIFIKLYDRNGDTVFHTAGKLQKFGIVLHLITSVTPAKQNEILRLSNKRGITVENMSIPAPISVLTEHRVANEELKQDHLELRQKHDHLKQKFAHQKKAANTIFYNIFYIFGHSSA
ncbi:uncharacterized protein [Watersipora subatra]|uniref:uncharacterized protein isoform X2 n=1 Tax=Watersipora subatra TaxID=2589382 RepID=UPI00355B5931